jgi:hypothetical protein
MLAAGSLVGAVGACGMGSCEAEGLLVWALVRGGRDWEEQSMSVGRVTQSQSYLGEALEGRGAGSVLCSHGSG